MKSPNNLLDFLMRSCFDGKSREGANMKQTPRQELIGEAFRADGVSSAKFVDQHVKGLITRDELIFRLSDVIMQAWIRDINFKVSNDVVREISKAYDTVLAA